MGKIGVCSNNIGCRWYKARREVDLGQILGVHRNLVESISVVCVRFDKKEKNHWLKFPREPCCLSEILWLSVKGFFSVNKNSSWKVFFVHIGLLGFYPVKNRMFVEWAWRNHIDMNTIGTDVGPGTNPVDLYTTRTGVLILHHYFHKLLRVFTIAR